MYGACKDEDVGRLMKKLQSAMLSKAFSNTDWLGRGNRG
jgi:hypothetical protein